ncbi:MAG: MarR family transcriptional regulator [Pseudomonadota bacterium]
MPTDSPISDETRQLANELRVALHHIFRRIRQEGDDGPSGITLLQKLLLSTIGQHAGIGVAELARLEKLRGPTISGHIKALEKAGLVRRDTSNPDDRRRVGLHITEPGAAVLADIRNRRLDWIAERLVKLPPEGAQALRNAMTYLNQIGE